MTQPQAPKHTALLPCPFCGEAEALDLSVYDIQPDDYHGGQVRCIECDAVGANAISLEGWLSSPEEARLAAIEAWNRRAPISAIEPDPSSSAQEEAKALREYAFELTKAFTSLTAGGSEYFGRRIGDMYTADIPFCLERIRESKANLFAEMKDARRQAAREASSAQEVRAALEKAQKALAMLTEPNAIQNTSVMHAWAHVLEAEQAARKALASAPPVRSQEDGE